MKGIYNIQNRRINKITLLILIAITGLLIFDPTSSSAQKDCGQTLEQARRYYEIGQIEKVPGLCETCMDNGFDKSQKTEAYQLMVLTYQYDNKPQDAETKYKELLKHDPEFTLNENTASAEMLHLYNTYHAPPIYSIGLLGGVNSAFGQRIESYSLSNLNEDEENLSKYSSNGLGFQAGITVKKYISKKFELSLDFLYQNIRYERTLNQLGFSDLIVAEEQNQFNIPLSLTYDYDLGKKFSPYVRLGAGFSYLIGAEATLERTYNSTGIQELPNVTGPPIDVSGQRNSINVFSVAGLGLKYKVPRGVIYVDFRHHWYFLQQNRPSKRYENNVLVYEYHYLDDDFKLGNLALSLGYTYSFHKIKLKKNRKVTTNE